MNLSEPSSNPLSWKLTKPQVAVLKALVCKPLQAHGGRLRTIRVLYHRGFVARDLNAGLWFPTSWGYRALTRLKLKL